MGTVWGGGFGPTRCWEEPECVPALGWGAVMEGPRAVPLPQPLPLRAWGSRQTSHLSPQPSPAAAVQSLSPVLTPSCPPLRFPHLQGVGMCLRSHYTSTRGWGGGGGSAWRPGPLTPCNMGGGSCRPQPRIACAKPKCCPQPPHSCSSSQSWGGQLMRPLSGAARDLTSSTLWLIGHRWGPENDGNPAAH